MFLEVRFNSLRQLRLVRVGKLIDAKSAIPEQLR
jgi:hypothetical protein